MDKEDQEAKIGREEGNCDSEGASEDPRKSKENWGQVAEEHSTEKKEHARNSDLDILYENYIHFEIRIVAFRFAGSKPKFGGYSVIDNEFWICEIPENASNPTQIEESINDQMRKFFHDQKFNFVLERVDSKTIFKGKQRVNKKN